MARMEMDLKFTVRRRWWVRPFLWSLMLFAASVAPFLDEDDERFGGLAAWAGELLAKHGLRIDVDPD